MATVADEGNGPVAHVPVEGCLAWLMMLAANPTLAARDRTRQFAEFDRLVRTGEPLDMQLVHEFGELTSKVFGKTLLAAVKQSRERGLAPAAK